MRNQEILRGIEAVQEICGAFQALRGKVQDEQQLRAAAEYMLAQIVEKNPAMGHFGDMEQTANPSDILTLGRCVVSGANTDGLCAQFSSVLSSASGSQFSFPVELNTARGFTMVLETDPPGEFASGLAQRVLLGVLQSREVFFRCADLVTNGNFFAFLYDFIRAFPEKSGGSITSGRYELEPVLHELEETSMRILSALGGGYPDVFAYNAANAAKLATCAATIYFPGDLQEETVSRLRVLADNAEKTGMGLIFIGDHTAAGKCLGFADYHFVCTSDGMHPDTVGAIRFCPEPSLVLSDDLLEEVKKKLAQRSKIDTLYAHHPELDKEYLGMDSTQVLRVPFAIDKDGIIQYFELGGDAPPHALVSGSTGSGKSVALHTILMQIVRNYHPDDVEIWAIDYKAVEFDSYIAHHSPHFRVVGHDSSEEFSFSLLDLLNEEYERRQQMFLDAGVKNIAGYRAKMGPHSMPRIVVFVDEFQIMTQAVQNYTGGTDYRTILENLLKLTRAMGISFLLCSQTIASGLSGLTEGARDQIGCRICLKHDDDAEIRETLKLSGDEASEIIRRAKNLKKGQAIYKRSLLSGQTAPGGRSYEYQELNILYIEDSVKDRILDEVTRRIGEDYTPKKEIFVRGGGRISLEERVRHPMQRFLYCDYEPKEDCLEWYPAAPTTLADSFCVELENNEGSNILLVGEDDDLRESIVFHSVCGFLMNPENRVIASFVDENYSDRARMIGQLQKIQNPRLMFNIGLTDTLDTLAALQKIQPIEDGRTIYLWYGLDKLKNEIFLRDQDREDAEQSDKGENPAKSPEKDPVADLTDFLDELDSGALSGDAMKPAADGSALTCDDCRRILLQLFEDGPENGHISFVLFNNVKAMKKSKCLNIESFEHKLGTKMTTEDAYTLFGSSMAGGKADSNTVVYDRGDGQTTPLRPYRMPSEEWIETFSLLLEQ